MKEELKTHPDGILTGLRIAVSVSGHGRGSNLQAILDACEGGDLTGQVVVVISTTEGTPALDRARNKGIETLTVTSKQFTLPEQLDAELVRLLQERDVELICLAGYMRKITSTLMQAFRGRIMNIHPALLPLFGGKGMYGIHVHEAVLASGMKVSGCTVHLVDEEYDTGPIVAQTAIPVEEGDTPETLAARVLIEEHRLYPRAIQLFAERRIVFEGKKVKVI